MPGPIVTRLTAKFGTHESGLSLLPGCNLFMAKNDNCAAYEIQKHLNKLIGDNTGLGNQLFIRIENGVKVVISNPPAHMNSESSADQVIEKIRAAIEGICGLCDATNPKKHSR